MKLLATLLLLGACAPRISNSDTRTTGVVVSGSALASEIGANVLAYGGNAVDAAVATAFALAVVEPTMSGIGGRTQILMRAPDGTVHGLDGATEVPAGYVSKGAADESAYGYATIAVPGTVSVLATALERHGTWTLARVLAPAIALATNGFDLTAPEASRIAGEATRLREFDGSRTNFLNRDGTPYQAGETLRQPQLAATLRMIADSGADVFYRGSIAARIDADMRAHGGFVRAADLAQYRTQEAIVVRGSYRGRELIGTHLPASGATTIEALHILEHFEPARMTGAAWIDLVAQALLLAFEDRETNHGTLRAQAAIITSKARAAELAVRVRAPGARVPGDAQPDAYEPPNTTHLSVVDAAGGAVALTQSVGPNLGSRVATNGLGFIYAATMGYLGNAAPGDRPFSSQSPLMVVEEGRLRYVIGGAGARRIISALVQTFARAMDEDLPLERALAAPRFHVSGRNVYIERRPGAAWSEQVEDQLQRLGYNVQVNTEPEYFARLNAIAIDPRTRQPRGYPDPRWPGHAAYADR